MAYQKKKSAPKKESAPTEESQLLTKLDNYFRSALDHPTWQAWRKNALQCFRYRENDQWSSAELVELKSRGQPPTVNNQISVTIERMVGQFVKQKVRIGYRGRNPQDQPAAQALSDTFLFIRQNNGLEFEEREMADDGFTGGFGCLETYITFDDLYQPEIRIKQIDPFDLFPDPYSRRYDWNDDGQYICRAKWVDLDEAKKLYPAKARELQGLMSRSSTTLTSDTTSTSAADSFRNADYIDSKTERVRLVECWYKDKEKESVCLFADGTVVDKDSLILIEPNGQKRQLTKDQLEELKKNIPDYEEVDRINSKLKVGVFTSNVLLEKKDSELKRFPFVPYFVHRKKSGEPYSLVFIALSMQDAINKRESKALHLLNTNQAIYETGVVEDKAALATEKARPDGQIELARGGMEKFQLHNNLELANTQFAMHSEAKNDFRRITGINPDALGERSEVRSGIGIARKQAMTDVIIAPIFDNLRRTRQILAANVLELIQHYYTEPKIFYITDDLNATKSIALNQSDPVTGQHIDVKQGIYDVVVDDLPDVTTMQEEQFQMIATVLPQVLPFGPFWTKILFQLSDIRNKDEIVKQIEQMSQPPPSDAKFSVALQWSELTPQEKAIFAAKKLGMPELAQIEMTSGTEPAHIVKAKTDLAKEQAKGQQEQGKLAAEQTKTQGEIIKAKIEVGKAQMGMQHEREKHQMDMTKKQIEIAQTMAKGAAENGAEGDKNSV